MTGLLTESFNLEAVMKIGIALLLSLIIGVEREIKKKPIGLKTSAVIATFSCLLTIISMEAAYLVPARDDINITMDPLRLSAQIVSGIGFLGAGAILRRDNDNITGLTTAAMIWGSAGIGIAVGAGFYIEAFFAVISVMLVIEMIAPFLSRFGPRRLRMKEASCIVIISDKSKIEELVEYLRKESMEIDHMRIRQFQTEQHQYRHELQFKLSALPKKSTSSLYVELTTLSFVESVELVIYP
ncbi:MULTISPECIES: MgtC/SapB family protein [Sporosarcina]|uniref:MgtC/SapB family protein n=1 Tax=Sporosarcina TaxID=1569 RepID=UPI00129B13E3|nr:MULTISPECIES: MgtC/SapB family protein [Sporosarcina]GKV66589.1 methyltransferase [Sporosarcina sp. NCCP-2331]GLB56925.1 methyltransferase [Sporosarcina sp. NCCP-2378]